MTNNNANSLKQEMIKRVVDAYVEAKYPVNSKKNDDILFNNYQVKYTGKEFK